MSGKSPRRHSKTNQANFRSSTYPGRPGWRERKPIQSTGRNGRKIRLALASVPGNSMATAISVPNNPPGRADARFCSVNKRVTLPMVRARRDPTARAWLVAIPDLRKLGTTMPAKNKPSVTQPASCKTEGAFCILP